MYWQRCSAVNPCSPGVTVSHICFVLSPPHHSQMSPAHLSMLWAEPSTCSTSFISAHYSNKLHAYMHSPTPIFFKDHDQLSLILDILGTPSIDDFYAISSPRSREYIRALPFRKGKDFKAMFYGANELVSLQMIH